MIGIDADGILFDYIGWIAGWVNRRVGSVVASVDTATDWDTLKAWGHSHLKYELQDWLRRPGNVVSIPVLPGAYDFLKQVARLDDFCIVTSCPAWWHQEREEALLKNFNIPYGRIVFSHDKGGITLDALVDDKPENFIRVAGRRVLMDRPWNRNTSIYCCRVRDYDHAIGVIRGDE